MFIGVYGNTVRSKKDYFKIIYLYEESSTGGEPTSNERWCDYTTQYIDANIISALKEGSKPNSYLWGLIDVPDAEEEVKVGDTVYFLAIKYGSGGTFGNSVGNLFVPCAFLLKDKALQVKNNLDIYEKWNEKIAGYNLTYEPWIGYFESYEGCQVVEMEVRIK